MQIFSQRLFQEVNLSSTGIEYGWLIIPFLPRGSVENAARKYSFDFAFVKLN